MMLIDELKADLHRLLSFGIDPPDRISIWMLIRHALAPRFLPVVLLRLTLACYRRRIGLVARLFSLANFVLFGLEVSMRSKIGPGLVIPHTFGTVLGAESIGSNVTIYHQVTVGAKKMDLGFDVDCRPRIGNNVVIGSGAKVLGCVAVGDGVVIGANAVVTKSLPNGVLAVGVPARITRT